MDLILVGNLVVFGGWAYVLSVVVIALMRRHARRVETKRVEALVGHVVVDRSWESIERAGLTVGIPNSAWDVETRRILDREDRADAREAATR